MSISHRSTELADDRRERSFKSAGLPVVGVLFSRAGEDKSAQLSLSPERGTREPFFRPAAPWTRPGGLRFCCFSPETLRATRDPERGHAQFAHTTSKPEDKHQSAATTQNHTGFTSAVQTSQPTNTIIDTSAHSTVQPQQPLIIHTIYPDQEHHPDPIIHPDLPLHPDPRRSTLPPQL